jgi:hypothetical protein
VPPDRYPAFSRGKRAIFCGVGSQLMEHECHRLTGFRAQQYLRTIDLQCYLGYGVSSRSSGSASIPPIAGGSGSCDDAIDGYGRQLRPRSAPSSCSRRACGRRYGATVASAFLTRWSSSATSKRWCSSALALGDIDVDANHSLCAAITP